jgi:hypothetical protein
MYGINRYQEDSQLATDDDAVQEFARNAGAENQDREWLLTSYDIWVKNPFYAGAPGRHPEADWHDDEEFVLHLETNQMVEVPFASALLPADSWEDDIPF